MFLLQTGPTSTTKKKAGTPNILQNRIKERRRFDTLYSFDQKSALFWKFFFAKESQIEVYFTQIPTTFCTTRRLDKL